MKARLGIRLAVATALALGGIAIGEVARPRKANAVPAVCVEVHRYQNGTPVTVWPYTCIGSQNGTCTLRVNDTGPIIGTGVGFILCVDLS